MYGGVHFIFGLRNQIGTRINRLEYGYWNTAVGLVDHDNP